MPRDSLRALSRAGHRPNSRCSNRNDVSCTATTDESISVAFSHVPPQILIIRQIGGGRGLLGDDTKTGRQHAQEAADKETNHKEQHGGPPSSRPRDRRVRLQRHADSPQSSGLRRNGRDLGVSRFGSR